MSVYTICTVILVLSVTDAARTRMSATASVSSACDTKGCSHACDTVGELPLCVCPSDMALESDGKTCKETTSFLIAMFRGIRIYNEESEDEVTVAPVKARSLDYDYGKKALYAYSNYTIMRYPLSKGKSAPQVSLITRTDTAVTSMAVDWVHDVIYFISEQESSLGVTSLDGTQRTILNHNESSSAGWRSLVVDPYAKKLFWIGNRGVHSSGLEGEELETNLIDWMKPDRIALDTSEQLIYIIGRRGVGSNKYIARASYNGTKVGDDVEISQPATVDVFGFGVVRNTAYWESSHGGEVLYKCDLGKAEDDKKATLFVVAEINQIVYDMKLYHQDVQK